MSEAEVHPFGTGLIVVFSNKAPGKESINEDSAAIIPYLKDSGVLVVADGAGGLPSGAKASEIAITNLRNSMKACLKKDLPLRTAIMDGIEKANSQIQSLSIGAGTTISVAEIVGNTIRTYHVGDSQIMVVGQKGKLKMQTMSHSPVGYAMEAGFIGDNEALMHDERHIVSNLLGYPDMRIEVGTQMELSAKDTVIVASDGLYDNLATDEIVEECRKGQLDDICKAVTATCYQRMSEPLENQPSKIDDLTIILFRQQESA